MGSRSAGFACAALVLCSLVTACTSAATDTPQPQLLMLNCIREAQNGDASKLVDALANCRFADPALYDNLVAAAGGASPSTAAAPGIDPTNGYPYTDWNGKLPVTVSGSGNQEVKGIVWPGGTVRSEISVAKAASGTCAAFLHVESADPAVLDQFDAPPVTATTAKKGHGTASGTLGPSTYWLTIGGDPGCRWTVKIGH